MRPESSDALAEVLRENAPAPDDLARARMEKRILAAMTQPRARSRTSNVRWIAAGSALAVAAAVLVWILLPKDPAASPIARFERREGMASLERGTLEEGSPLRTSATEVADIRIEGSRVRIEPGSLVRIATLSRERVAIELERGSVRVAFHPRERGRERMTVETPNARVEVVGTVFRVSVERDETTVSVSEGVVRVIPLREGEPRLVRAGQETRVGAPPVEAERPPAIDPPAAVVVPQPIPEEAAPVEEDPRARLDEARRLVLGQRAADALPILRSLTRPPTPAAVRTDAWTLMADVHQAARAYGDAAHAYEEAARAGRGTLDGHNAIYALAHLQEQRLGDRDAARASYERYLQEAPDGALALQARRALCRLGVAERCGEVP